MQKAFLLVTFSLASVLALTSCGLDCVEKKTGMHKSSRTLKESKENGLLKFQFIANKSSFQLDSGLVFNIKGAWVENNWKYECINNKAVIVKDSSDQFVVDAHYQGDASLFINYWLENHPLGAVLDYKYTGQDTIRLSLYKDTSFISTKNKMTPEVITFVRRKVSR